MESVSVCSWPLPTLSLYLFMEGVHDSRLVYMQMDGEHNISCALAFWSEPPSRSQHFWKLIMERRGQHISYIYFLSQDLLLEYRELNFSRCQRLNQKVPWTIHGKWQLTCQLGKPHCYNNAEFLIHELYIFPSESELIRTKVYPNYWLFISFWQARTWCVWSITNKNTKTLNYT